MAYNYTNLESMIPLFGTMNSHTGSFINQLAAAITTAAVGAVSATPTSTTSSAAHVEHSKRECTPEPPPAPKLSSLASPTMKPNQGTAPMDVENDSETEGPPVNAIMTTTAAASTSIATKAVNKCAPLHMHDPNLFLNGLLSNNSLNSGYMFFPTAATAAGTTNATSAGSMLMDPSAMMAAAMQQMQQSYASYALPTAEGAAVDGTAVQLATADSYAAGTAPAMKDVIKTKSSILFPPNPNAPPPTIRERPPGCRTVFVGGLPENITDDIIREIFESCGEITTLRMSKKNFCHIRYRHEASIDRAIYLSGYRVRISTANEPANFGRLHVDYAQARDDQYDYECKQRQLQREQRHRERMSLDRLRSQSPPPIQHYTDHEASVVAEHLRSNDTFVKAIQTITIWLERGDCTKRNANVFYSMMQSTHAHVRRLHTDKQQLEDDLRKARESYRKQMLTMSSQFTQIEKVFSAASHKKVWDHFTKAQRKNIDQWKKLATELRSVQIEDDEMDVSDDDREYHGNSQAKRARYDSENLKEENDSLRCQLEAIRNEMSLERTDIKYDSDFREKQIKVLQETIRNMQTQLLQTKIKEQKDAKAIQQLEQRLKEAGVKQLLLKTKIKETAVRLRDKETASVNSEGSEIIIDEPTSVDAEQTNNHKQQDERVSKELYKCLESNLQVIDIDVYKSDDDVRIIEEEQDEVVEVPKFMAKTQQEHKNGQLTVVQEKESGIAKASMKGNNEEKLQAGLKEDIRESLKVDLQESLKVNLNENLKVGLLESPKVDLQESLKFNLKETSESNNLQAAEAANDKQLLQAETVKQLPLQVGVQPVESNLLTLAEAKIIALTAAFLLVQPHGVSTSAICDYLRPALTGCELAPPTLSLLLRKYPNLFEAVAVGDKWKFCGFMQNTKYETTLM